MQSVLNLDPDVKPPTDREASAARMANWLRIIAKLYAVTFAVGFIPVVNLIAGLVHAVLVLVYPPCLLGWLLVYAFRLDRGNRFNRRTYKDVLISVVLFVGTIIVSVALLLIVGAAKS